MKKLVLAISIIGFISGCTQPKSDSSKISHLDTIEFYVPDSTKIPDGKYGEMVKYGRELMLHTAFYIGPEGINGKYLRNKINCTNCHQEAGTKPYSFSLMRSHELYPRYRAREGRVLSLAERINNCVMRPHNGIPLPLDSKEMIAFLAYLRWINSSIVRSTYMRGEKNLQINFPDRAADPDKGKLLYNRNCSRCHGSGGEGIMVADKSAYLYPPLWGDMGYQPGSSMHRVIKMAEWIKANMPQDSAKWDKPILSDEDALDVAAFVNNDNIHKRPSPKSFDYPFLEDKAIDYDKGPYVDTFSEENHKYGPYKPIIEFLKSKGMKERN